MIVRGRVVAKSHIQLAAATAVSLIIGHGDLRYLHRHCCFQFKAEMLHKSSTPKPESVRFNPSCSLNL